MSSQIKGLSQFIADVRATTTPESERARVQTELANLRRKLANNKGSKDASIKSKTGYEHRKVVSKLLYIYLLGYDVDIGTDEVNALLQMPKFAEKQVGYVALELLLNAKTELQNRIETVVESDLRSSKEIITSLALNYVASYDLRTMKLSENLENLVYQLMVSPTSASAVAKKAALTFLNFFRQDPVRFCSGPDWLDRVERIAVILIDPHRDVSIAFVSLLLGIAQVSPQSVPSTVTKTLVQKLDDVFALVDNEGNELDYYDVSAPWLVSKLCQLLCHLSVSTSELVDEIRATVTSILSFCTDNMDEGDTEKIEANAGKQRSGLRGSQQHKNALAFVFLDALKLASVLHIETWNQELTRSALQTVKAMFVSRDPNMRYLALEAVQLFATPLPRTSRQVNNNNNNKLIRYDSGTGSISSGSSRDSSGPDLQKLSLKTADIDDNHIIKVVLNLVKDRDMSIRQQALDALYKLVDQDSVELAAAELLDMLVLSDLQIRPQMVGRLAAMIERFATSHEWYFDTNISLLVIGGSYASDEVWERLAQVVVNNPALHAYAVKKICETLSDSREIYSVKHSVAEKTSEAIVKFSAFILGEFAGHYDGDPIDLFVLLQDQVAYASWNTRAVLLTAFAKFAARFPQLRSSVADSLGLYLNAPNSEVQKRATEYLVMLRPENSDLLSIFLEPMPPFGKESSELLFQQMGETGKIESSRPIKAKAPTETLTKDTPALIPTKTGFASNSANLSSTHISFNGTLSSGSAAASQTMNSQSTVSINDHRAPLSATTSGSSARTHHLSSNWEFGFKRMLTHSEAVLYQDAILQIGCKYQFNRTQGRVHLFFKNISSFEISSFNVMVNSPMSEETLFLQSRLPQLSILRSGQTVESIIDCEARQPFAITPTCRITYWANSFGEINIRLPIVLERFMTPSPPITFDQFQERWNQISDEFEFTKSARNYSSSKAAKSVDKDEDVLKGFQYSVVPSAPPGSYFGAGILHTSVGGLCGCLIVLQPDSSKSNCKVTVRTTSKKLTAVILANNVSMAYQL